MNMVELFDMFKGDHADTFGGVRSTVVQPTDFKWINKPAIVRGEDFEYKATVLCSFPKSNGKVRYIVEDNGRLFIQRKEQLSFLYGEPGVGPNS